MAKRKLSVIAIIPARNEEKHIVGCIDAIHAAAARAKDVRVSIVVTDGGSTDATKVFPYTFLPGSHFHV